MACFVLNMDVSKGWRTSRTSAVTMSVENAPSVSRRQLLSSICATALIAALPPVEVQANVNLMAAKRSYFRYVPRIEEGTNFFVMEMYPAVEKGDWETLMNAFMKTSVARAGSEKAVNDIDPKTTYIDRQFFTPMKTWSNSFAEKGTSPKSRKLLEKEEAFEKAMGKLEKAIKAKDLEATKAGWESAKVALNDYVDIANYGLSRELRKLTTIPDDLSTYKPLSARPTTTF